MRNNNEINNQDFSLIDYPHLQRRDLCEAHDDYFEEFLFMISLVLAYWQLKNVTHNFPRIFSSKSSFQLIILFLLLIERKEDIDLFDVVVCVYMKMFI